MIAITDKSKCCGCTACASICPRNCIEMNSDEEGFLYPIVDESLCIDCHLCEKVCPVINVKPDIPFYQKGFIAQNRNEDIRATSTSGGIFSAISTYIIQRNGVVFGAAYDENFNVFHTKVESVEELKRFRNSKYVQSDLKSTFKDVKSLLENGRLVCFSGTPCQIEGLKCYIDNDYKNLITVDVVCHGVPSPLIWDKYLSYVKDKVGQFSNILFRDKHYGYKYSTMSLFDKAGKKLYAFGVDTDPMLRAFFSDICDRPICYNCMFKKRYRVSDFTIWDCFSVYNFDKTFDDDLGTNRVLVNTKKGGLIFEAIKPYLKWKEVAADELTRGVKEMYESVIKNPKREEFLDAAHRLSAQTLFNKYFPCNLHTKTERFGRILLYKTGLYPIIKRIINNYHGR